MENRISEHLDYQFFCTHLSLPFVVFDKDLELLSLSDHAKVLLQSEDTGTDPTESFSFNDEQRSQILALPHGEELTVNVMHAISATEVLPIEMNVKKTDDETPFFFCEINESASTQSPAGWGQILGSLSHDLSNPLAIIKIQCESIALKAKSQPSFTAEEVVTRFEKLNKSAEKLNDLIKIMKGMAKELLRGKTTETQRYLDAKQK
ncbi:MAG: hypothetical protein AAF203_07920 [Pseudomonadota bacterium]